MATRSRTDYLVVHCSATPASHDIGAVEIRAWHRAQGWSDFGYLLVIRRDGRLESGRDVHAIGSHVKGYNDRSLGICLVGGCNEKMAPEDNFTDDQLRVLAIVLDIYLDFWPKAEVLGHRDLSPDKDGDGTVEPEEWLKACPSFDVREWWKSNGR
jgi:N-acetylmuramoyl-L-alanine amidase